MYIKLSISNIKTVNKKNHKLCSNCFSSISYETLLDLMNVNEIPRKTLFIIENELNTTNFPNETCTDCKCTVFFLFPGLGYLTYIMSAGSY